MILDRGETLHENAPSNEEIQKTNQGTRRSIISQRTSQNFVNFAFKNLFSEDLSQCLILSKLAFTSVTIIRAVELCLQVL